MRVNSYPMFVGSWKIVKTWRSKNANNKSKISHCETTYTSSNRMCEI